GDVPNRFLAWWQIRISKRMRVAPILEYRNGFVYSRVDQLQNYVGTPDSSRFPNFFSLDARLSRDLPVSSKYTFRLSLTGYNLTNHFNPIEVHANIDDPKLGVFIGRLK